MASQDRTSEFFSLCQSLPPPPPNTAQTKAPPPPLSTGRYNSTADATDELRTFHKTASILSKDIYSTSTLLSELTSLIHSRSGSLFVDESSKVNNLVLRIKVNIESLNTKLDASNEMIQRNKRRLGRNSQAGLEASNLVGQLQEEFVNTTKGFKEVLQVRSDRIKERSDRESHLLGSDNTNEPQERISLLGNKPKVYNQDVANADGMAHGGFGSQNRLGSGLNSFGAGGFGNNGSAGGLGGLSAEGPRLDLTTAMMQNSGQMQPGESSMQLPRPCKY
jgi:syntaxin 5